MKRVIAPFCFMAGVCIGLGWVASSFRGACFIGSDGSWFVQAHAGTLSAGAVLKNGPPAIGLVASSDWTLTPCAISNDERPAFLFLGAHGDHFQWVQFSYTALSQYGLVALDCPLWAPAVLLFSLSLLLSRRRKVPPRACPACGYDLRGASSDRCSECGSPITDSRIEEAMRSTTRRRSR